MEKIERLYLRLLAFICGS